LRPEAVRPVLLGDHDPHKPFPDPEQADSNLIAVGGDLCRVRLLQAYAQGIFPWFGEDDPILWWSPDPRGVLEPQKIHISRSLRKTARKSGWKVAMDRDFAGVVSACAAPRFGQGGTWITAEVQAAYLDLFVAGYAHSIEIYLDKKLVGGLYGVALGALFFGESMFSREPDASKLALVLLARHLENWGFALIDTQFLTPHLQNMGACEISRAEFLQRLTILKKHAPAAPWKITLPWGVVF
jgi:leucyl/phenylalanyl-tRNA--protein transferase